jgi:hypothetical protein
VLVDVDDRLCGGEKTGGRGREESAAAEIHAGNDTRKPPAPLETGGFVNSRNYAPAACVS